MRIKNVVQKAEALKINDHYDAGAMELMEIVETYPNDRFDLVRVAFKYGYMQGVKAEKAALKQRR